MTVGLNSCDLVRNVKFIILTPRNTELVGSLMNVYQIKIGGENTGY